MRIGSLLTEARPFTLRRSASPAPGAGDIGASRIPDDSPRLGRVILREPLVLDLLTIAGDGTEGYTGDGGRRQPRSSSIRIRS
jgi:hypothetical protein